MSEDHRYWSKEKIEMSVDEIFEASLEMAQWIHSEFECDTPCTQNSKDFDDKVTYLLTALPELKSKVHTLQSKLTEVEVVLQWASENVECVHDYCSPTRWKAVVGVNVFHAPTLYQALHSAWEEREVKP